MVAMKEKLANTMSSSWGRYQLQEKIGQCGFWYVKWDDKQAKRSDR